MATLDPVTRLRDLEQRLEALPQPPNNGGSLAAAPPELGAAGAGVATGEPVGEPTSAATSPADDPEVVQEAVEEVVETSLHQTVSRRELFGRGRADEEE